eukprot:m.185219 g.185219  ORF g.185219 m.185219 type:complete len:433 (+) comp15567_c0_seq7:221-1519(+)
MELQEIRPYMGATTMQPLSWVVAIGIASAFILGFSMGSNDVANSFGTTVGAGILTMRQALVVAAIFDVTGGVTLGVGVANTIASKIIDVDIFADEPGLYALGMLSASLGAGACVATATKFGIPISTSHAVVGAVAGFSFVESSQGVIWIGKGASGMLGIVLSWFISPVFAGIVAVFIYLITKKYCLEAPKDIAFERHKRLASVMMGWITCLVIIFVAYEVTESGTIHDWLNIVFAVIGFLLISGISYKFLIPWMIHRARINNELEKAEQKKSSFGSRNSADIELEETMDTNPLIEEAPSETETATSSSDTYDPELEDRFNALNIMTACFMAFSHGANDIANAAGPLVAIWDTYLNGSVDGKVDIHYWIVILACFGALVSCFVILFKVNSRCCHRPGYVGSLRNQNRSDKIDEDYCISRLLNESGNSNFSSCG